MNPGALLRDIAAAEPDATAFVEGARRLTYREWDALSDRVAGTLVEMGLTPGDVVALLLPTGIDYPVTYVGALKAGVVTTGINTRYRSREIGHILENSLARVLVVADPSLRSLAESVAPSTLQHVVEPTALLEGSATSRAFAPAGRQPAVIVYTSGTTGLPKGATYTFGSLERIRGIEAAAGVHARPRVLAAVPLPHMAFMTKIVSAIERRQFTVLAERWSARLALETIQRERLTDAGGIPTQLTLMLMDPEFDRFDLSSLRYITLGGAPASADLIREIRERFGVPVIVRYSCTEVGLATGTRPRDDDETVATTVGRPLPGVDVRIHEPDADGIGEICVRSDAMMTGYWRDPEQTAQAIDAEGFFHTGDLGRFDDGGNLRIAGRRKEMYIRGGYNVYPAEVEAVLREHPKVVLAAVIGVADAVLGERGRAFVVPRDPSDAPDPGELQAFVAERIADYKVPDEIETRAELPLTPMHKIDKQALRQK